MRETRVYLDEGQNWMWTVCLCVCFVVGGVQKDKIKKDKYMYKTISIGMILLTLIESCTGYDIKV